MKQTVTITQADYDEAARIRRGWYDDQNHVNPLLRSPTALALARDAALPHPEKWAVTDTGLTRFCRRRDLDRAKPEAWTALPEAAALLEKHWDDPNTPCPALPVTFEIDAEAVPLVGRV